MNLVIGNTSQLSYYFPNDYIKISSRNINLDYIKNNKWNAVYICFAEQRIYDSNIDYITPNYIYTLQIINSILECTDKIVCYTSCELWNNLSGYIDLDTAPNFDINNEYTISKFLLLNKIKQLRKINERYNKVIFIHPFYFNSAYRSNYFLFGKIFDSILNKKVIDVGNLNFYRDIVHAQYIVDKSIEANSDLVVGAGKLFNVKDFIVDLYNYFDMDFENYTKINNFSSSGKEKLIMAKVNINWDYTYQNLLNDTVNDLKKVKG